MRFNPDSTLNTLNQTELFVRFSPQLNHHFKNTNTTLIIGQLEYWFKKYKNGFFKFMEPCQHNQYKQGDSWMEELCISRRIFNKAFDLVGTRHKSKSLFHQAVDKFEGKLYASYYDRDENKTYYLRNHQFVQQYLFKKEGQDLQSKRVPLRNGTNCRSHIYKDTKNTPDIINPPKSPLKVYEQSLDNGTVNREGEEKNLNHEKSQPQDREASGSNSPQILRESHQRITHQTHELTPFSKVEVDTLQKMQQVWIKHMGKFVKTPSLNFRTSHPQNMLQAFKAFFSNCLDRWERFCMRVASSKFLTGQITSYAVWLPRVIKPDMIAKITEGIYGVDTSICLENPETEINKIKALKQAEELKLQRQRQQALEEIENSPASSQEKILRSKLLNYAGVQQYKSLFSRVSVQTLEGGLETLNDGSPPFAHKQGLRLICVDETELRELKTLLNYSEVKNQVTILEIITLGEEKAIEEVMNSDIVQREKEVRCELIKADSATYVTYFKQAQIDVLEGKVEISFESQASLSYVKSYLRLFNFYEPVFKLFNVKLEGA